MDDTPSQAPSPPRRLAGPTPTLFEWAGGMTAFERLTSLFYSRVPSDPLLAPVFARMPAEHAEHVAHFLAEVMGGPPAYSTTRGTERGGHVGMVVRHLGRALTGEQRARWVQLLLACADELGFPDDPEFRSAFVAYLEWGSRLAVMNSQPGVPVPGPSPMPIWGWGVPGGPYRGP